MCASLTHNMQMWMSVLLFLPATRMLSAPTLLGVFSAVAIQDIVEMDSPAQVWKYLSAMFPQS